MCISWRCMSYLQQLHAAAEAGAVQRFGYAVRSVELGTSLVAYADGCEHPHDPH